MGQYYKALLINAEGQCTTIRPHEYGSYSKLTEHSWIENEFVSVVLNQIWKSPKRVAWIGDYSRDVAENYTERLKRFELQKFKHYYKRVWKADRDNAKLPTRDFGDFAGLFLVNHSDKECITLEDYIKRCTDSDGWCMNPLPLLTACGNGQGGGDYYEEQSDFWLVGTWAFGLIELTDEKPKGYEELDVVFLDGHSKTSAEMVTIDAQ